MFETLYTYMRSITIFLFIVLIASCSIFHNSHSDKTTTKKNSKQPAATVVKPVMPISIDSLLRAMKVQVKPYAEVITKKFTAQKGLFTIHSAVGEDSLYFEIPDSLLGRDIMVINRLEKGPGGYGAYAGEELDEKTIFLEKGPDNTIVIRYDLVISEADSTDAIYKSVIKSNINPLVYSFPIKAYGKDSATYVVEASKFLKDKNFINGIGKSRLSKQVMEVLLKDHHIDYIHAYPLNVEVSISKNGMARGVDGAEGPISMVSHTSFIALPKKPLQRRFFDQRVGFFADYYYPYADNQQKIEIERFILRWRLEPRAEDRAKWEQGELVEPAKPIVYYIDPATPKQWRKYLVAGVNDWQAAFEQAGFKNAIIGKEWPENDTTMSMEDARYSFINYFPSEVKNAYGPNIHDPRSGEIIQSHIGWYHNVMELLHSWYMIQAAAVDPRARAAKFDDELMGELIRFVSSHEVGHTLGLRHNFGSSSQTPVDSLRNKTWLQKHGHTASIMDYARFNYVVQPEDHIPAEYLMPRIGEYDRWAIEWAYKCGGANAEADKKLMNKLITDSLARNPRLWFGDGESKEADDPRCQTEDLSNDPVKAGMYGIKNLQRILPNLPLWTHEKDGLYQGLTDMYTSLKDQYFRYINHMYRYIGGVYSTVRSEETTGDVYAPVAAAMQKDVLTFFNTQLFTTPTWLLNEKVTAKTVKPVQPDFVEDTQIKLLNSLLDIKKFNALLGSMRQFGEDKTLHVTEYLSIIHKGIWHELLDAQPAVTDPYRRNLQKSYIGAFQDILMSSSPDVVETDAFSIIRADVMQIQDEIRTAIPRVKDNLTRYHLEDLQARIKKMLMAKTN